MQCSVLHLRWAACSSAVLCSAVQCLQLCVRLPVNAGLPMVFGYRFESPREHHVQSTSTKWLLHLARHKLGGPATRASSRNHTPGSCTFVSDCFA